MLHSALTLNCRGRLLDLSTPAIMGILNLTPDSFYDGGKFQSIASALKQVEKMLDEGASIIDLGGMSSRPGAVVIGEEEELQRVLPVIEKIIETFPEAMLSIDTVRAKVAREAVARGAAIINDISAGSLDPDLWQTVVDLQVPYILMHMQGRPETMQNQPVYESVTVEVLDFLIAKVGALREMGAKDIIIDPGFGFGKSVEHNYELLQKMHVFQMLECPVLAGVSRKSMICKVLKVSPLKALNGTTALHMIALQQGARILRVHDVREAKEVIRLWQQLEKV